MRRWKRFIKHRKKGEGIMAVMTKPKSIIPLIGEDKSRKFIKKSNKKRLTVEKLNSFRNSSRIFKNE